MINPYDRATVQQLSCLCVYCMHTTNILHDMIVKNSLPCPARYVDAARIMHNHLTCYKVDESDMPKCT